MCSRGPRRTSPRVLHSNATPARGRPGAAEHSSSAETLEPPPSISSQEMEGLGTRIPSGCPAMSGFKKPHPPLSAYFGGCPSTRHREKRLVKICSAIGNTHSSVSAPRPESQHITVEMTWFLLSRPPVMKSLLLQAAMAQLALSPRRVTRVQESDSGE
ncbi:hypothetical protein EYF80_050119 [Liparis tanakae]|uniref:Uncharacterized protein n=1 Tax=Liparis tanakae TaxID=230148 RepID=A0A4Z2FG28_9TELE|nr:hypothetical protein EYF80_050119 [Liparis tanakae]